MATEKEELESTWKSLMVRFNVAYNYKSGDTTKDEEFLKYSYENLVQFCEQNPEYKEKLPQPKTKTSKKKEKRSLLKKLVF